MRYAVTPLFAASVFLFQLSTATAQTPVANLPLTCPSASAIGQTNCAAIWSIGHRPVISSSYCGEVLPGRGRQISRQPTR